MSRVSQRSPRPSAPGEPASLAFASLDAARTKELVRRALFTASTPSPLLTVGRYVLRRRVGSGASGVVYAAFDEVLDREVALKVLRRSAGIGDAETQLREAQAAAALKHPNVVAVFEAGLDGDTVYIAMELIEGRCLAEQETPRPWRETLELYLQAGEGLSAAHAAGLVHRDFKPANVAVGADGRARVLDFGLAAPVAGADCELPGAGRGPSYEGTPAYMAPELWTGQPASPASDQFSFCVALFEALAGAHPFLTGDRTDVIGAFNTAPRRNALPRAVPRRARKALLRGLSPNPAERWPSVPTLLSELRRAIAPQSGRAWLSAGAVAAAGVALWLGRGSAPACDAGAGAMAAAWSADRRALVEQALLATDVPYARATASSVATKIDGLSARWINAFNGNCRAHAEGTLSAELLDQRMACLTRTRDEMGDLVDALAAADAELAANAVRAVGSLASPDACERPADVAALDGEERQIAEQIQRTLARSRTAMWAVELAEASALADQAVRRARALGHAPITAEALEQLGKALAVANQRDEAVRVWSSAFDTAVAADDGPRAARIGARLAALLGDQAGKFDVGRTWGEVALAFARRPDTDDRVRARALEALGIVYDRGRQPEQALPYYDKVLAILRESAPDSLDLADALNNRGLALQAVGKLDESRRSLKEAIAIYRHLLGKEHPRVSKVLNGLGSLDMRQGQRADAIAHFAESLRIREAALGTHELTGRAHTNLGNAYLRADQPQRARPHLERAVVVLTDTVGADDWAVALPLGLLGDLHFEAGRYEEATAVYRRALAIDEGSLGPDHPDLAYNLAGLGEALLAVGDAGSARPLLERALALAEVEAHRSNRGRAQFALARTLRALDVEPGRASTLARAARANFAAVGANDNVARVDRWLRRPIRPAAVVREARPR